MKKGTKFDISISKEAALDLIRPGYYHGSGAGCLKDDMGIQVMCREWCTEDREEGDEDWIGIEECDYTEIAEGDEYQTFEIWL